MIYLVRNKETGWEGAVNEAIYKRCLKTPKVYECSTSDPTIPEGVFDDPYTIEKKSPGWYDVVGPDGPVNEKSLRKAEAEALLKTQTQ